MIVTKSELVVHCDVDNTLILWKEPEIYGRDKIELEYGGKTMYFTPHRPIIDLIKSYKQRGYYILVQTANGYDWGEKVVKAVGLEEYVDEVKTKPVKVVDDRAADHLTNSLVYLPENFYGNIRIS